MIGRIEIQLPIRYAIAGVSFLRKRRAGFAFINHSVLILSENLGKEINALQEWMEQNQTLYVAEMLYAAYIAWCRENYTAPKYSKSQIIEGWAGLSEEDQKRIFKVWGEAMNFGAKPIPGPKKKTGRG